MFKVGSLREHVDFWSNSIRASGFIINTIVEGYRIPFFDLPENFVTPNRSSPRCAAFRLEPCRLILGLSYLNRFILKQSVRFEDIRTVFDFFQSGYFFFTFDLKQ